MIYLINLIFIIILFFINIYILSTLNIKLPDDYLFHMSSETETIFRALNNILTYDNKFTFISISQLDDNNSYDSGIVKFDLSNIVTYNKPLSNYKPHYIQGFTEIKENRNYIAHKYSNPIHKPIKLKGINANYAYILKFKRLIDNIEFYYIQITQTFGGYFKDNSYKAISEILQYIIQNYPGEYIIVGDFNVQGHEKIFQYFLKDENYHICPFYKYITCNDGEGLASPDGLVVSKKLYKHIKYNIDIYPGQSYQHYMISAELFINGPNKTECAIDKKTLAYFEEISKNTKKNNFVNNPGNFNINKHIGKISNITVMQFEIPGNTLYRNKILTDKLNTISLKF